MKYIFVTGAPGSKWSSVVKNIYFSNSIDRSDHRDEWTYSRDVNDKKDLMHVGAYFDPGMECDLPESMSTLTRVQAEKLFDAPFSKDATGIRIIKSHIFGYDENIQYLRELWPESPIVLVHRSDDSCLGWWVKAGHFDIEYPNYKNYYKNFQRMAQLIQRQNQGILKAWHHYPGPEPQTNRLLASCLKIECPPLEYCQDFHINDIKVKVI